MSWLPEAHEVEPRSRGRRAVVGIVVTIIVLVLVAAALVAADSIARGMAEDAAASTIEGKLPENVDADVQVSIGGGFFLPQLVSGSFSDVTLTTDGATYDGIPFDAVVHASGVPTDTSGTIAHATADVAMNEDAVNELLELPGADPHLSLGDGTVSYEDSISVFGLSIAYTVTAEPTANGSTVDFAPVDAEVTSGIGGVDVGSVVDEILGGEPISVCVASRLPASVSLDEITVSESSAVLRLVGSDVPLSPSALSQPGSCDAP